MKKTMLGSLLLTLSSTSVYAHMGHVEHDLLAGMTVILAVVMATGLLYATGLVLTSKTVKISRQRYLSLSWLVLMVGGYMLLATA